MRPFMLPAPAALRGSRDRPADAAGRRADGRPAFAPLAELLATDHTVLTTDPRGINRSPVDDPDADSTPGMRADDLARLITHVDAGPAVCPRLQRRRGQRPGPGPVPAGPGAHRDRPRAPGDRMLADRDGGVPPTEDMVATYLPGRPRRRGAVPGRGEHPMPRE